MRVVNPNCEYCQARIPLGGRADRRFCSPACRDAAGRRRRGEVGGELQYCSSCLVPLIGYKSDARVCRRTLCRGWAQRHPGIPHPSTQPRRCDHCGGSIVHRNAKARYCHADCKHRAETERNPERINANARERYHNNQAVREYHREYQRVNIRRRRYLARMARKRTPEQYRTYWKAWYAQNRDLNGVRSAHRRALLLGNPASVGVSSRDWRRLVARYRGCCAYCGKKAEPVHMDHVIPLSRGRGGHRIGNILPACGECNFSKHAMLLVEWRYRARLVGIRAIVHRTMDAPFV